MAAVRFLLVIAFALAFGSVGVFGSDFIGYEKDYKKINCVELAKGPVATGRRAPRNDARGLIKIAEQEIGVREHTENSSPRIDQYCHYVGFKKVAWCAAFCSFCFGQAGYKEPKTAWCPSLFPAKRTVKEPLPGMIMGIYFTEKGRIAHVGIVTAVKGEWVICVEGNTNVGGSREGDAVMRKLRHKRTIAKYADWL